MSYVQWSEDDLQVQYSCGMRPPAQRHQQHKDAITVNMHSRDNKAPRYPVAKLRNCVANIQNLRSPLCTATKYPLLRRGCLGVTSAKATCTTMDRAR